MKDEYDFAESNPMPVSNASTTLSPVYFSIWMLKPATLRTYNMNDSPNLDCLLVKTKAVLLELIKTALFLQDYVLIGGSALALHLCHRQSEDLDFFTNIDLFTLYEAMIAAEQARG